MQTQPIYKTAEELGIEQWERDGLAALVGPLSRDHLRFDMGEFCGSVCCIGGHLAARAKISQRKYMGGNWRPRRWAFATPERGTFSKSLEGLFYPDSLSESDPYDATGPQAAHAIVNFLVTGDPTWSEVMAS